MCKVGFMLLLLHTNPADVYRELGRRIRRHRTAARLTQAHVAAIARISRASVANIEAGRQQVLVHHLYAIADALYLDSPAQLLPDPAVFRVGPDELSEVPVPEEGLTDQQRQQVLHLMSGGETEQGMERRTGFTFAELGIPVGERLTLVNSGIQCEVADERAGVLYEGRKHLLPELTTQLKKSPERLAGTPYWEYQGESLRRRWRRMQKQQDLDSEA